MKNLEKLMINNKISALAIDQRGALKRMMGENVKREEIIQFKELISKYLTKYSSAILLDPEYGWSASDMKDKDCGVIMAYEKTGYDKSEPGRLPDLLNQWSVKSLKEKGADAIKLLVYVDPDESDEINSQKEAFIERVGSECIGEEIPFFLEIISYDANIMDSKSKEYAEVRPQKVIDIMKEFSKKRYNVDVLKVETPVDMNFVEGFTNREICYSKKEAAELFKKQSEVTNLPFIFLSGGVSFDLFIDTIKFAKEAGSNFNGVLCGRATWANATEEYHKGGFEAVEKWMKTEGVKNIEKLNDTILEMANSIE